MTTPRLSRAASGQQVTATCPGRGLAFPYNESTPQPSIDKNEKLDSSVAVHPERQGSAARSGHLTCAGYWPPCRDVSCPLTLGRPGSTKNWVHVQPPFHLRLCRCTPCAHRLHLHLPSSGSPLMDRQAQTEVLTDVRRSSEPPTVGYPACGMHQNPSAVHLQLPAVSWCERRALR